MKNLYFQARIYCQLEAKYLSRSFCYFGKEMFRKAGWKGKKNSDSCHFSAILFLVS